MFPTLLERDVPLYGHEIADYWNDVGSMQELRQGNFDALTGVVQGRDAQGRRSRAAFGRATRSTLEGQVLMEPPVYIGEDCTIGPDARLTGPVVIGDGCTIGEGAVLRDVLVWPGTEVPPGRMLIGGIAGIARSRKGSAP